MKQALKVGIIGAGIGGVALHRALQQRGIQAHLFERAPAFGEIGAGVQMTPNAVKVLNALGLEQDLERVGFLPQAMVGRNWDDGDTLFRTQLRDVSPQQFGADFHHVHRADLHAILSQDVPASDASLSMNCTGVEPIAGGARAHFADGSHFDADVIIGADGIHSVVRNALWGESQASFTGHMCWRALVPVDQHPLPHVTPDVSFWMGPQAHIVTYYVKGGSAVNIVAVSESAEWVAESWTEPSSREDLLAAYTGWHSDIQTLLGQTDSNEIFKWGLFDRDPMERWSQGCVTLLGDAAHPMLPFLSQGAAMAIEDAYVLAEALDAHEQDVPAALAAYEQERLPRTARVQLEARERGRTYHLSNPQDLARRNAEMKQADQNAVGIKAEWVYQYDATSCRERFSADASVVS